MAKEEQPWKDDVDELDGFLQETMSQLGGAHWPAVALAMALIDTGLITPERLLTIIDATHDLATVRAMNGEEQNVTRVLAGLRDEVEFLSKLPKQNVLHWLQGAAGAALQSKPPRPKPQQPPDAPE